MLLCLMSRLRFEPQTSCVGSDHSTNWATAIAQAAVKIVWRKTFLNRSSKPCVGGYTPKRPRFEPEEVAPETNRGSTYFPTGDNRRPSSSEDGLTTTTTTTFGDPRHPKEVTTDDDDFAIQDIQDQVISDKRFCMTNWVNIKFMMNKQFNERLRSSIWQDPY